MKALVSALLWTAGLMHFCLLFSVMAIGLTVRPPRRLTPLMRRLMRTQMAVVGGRLRVAGLENLDPSRAYLFMGNHESMFDLFAIPAAVPVHAVGFEASYHFAIPLWGRLIRRWGNIPAHRGRIHKGLRSLKTAARTLRSGTSIVVLPEGGRTVTGRLGDFKKGPFLLALSARADIVPFVLTGMYAFNNVHSWHINPGPIGVVFGRPLPHEDFRGMTVAQLRCAVRAAMERLQRRYDCRCRRVGAAAGVAERD